MCLLTFPISYQRDVHNSENGEIFARGRTHREAKKKFITDFMMKKFDKKSNHNQNNELSNLLHA